MVNIMNWRKSSYSSGNGGECVEVGNADDVLVRDTTQTGTGPILRFSQDAWRRFTDQAKRLLGPAASLGATRYRGYRPSTGDADWPCAEPARENFLYVFKAPPRGRSCHRHGAQAVTPAAAIASAGPTPVGWHETHKNLGPA